MGKWKPLFVMIAVVVLGAAPAAWAGSQDGGESVLVGRISYVEGQLLRYIPEEQDWVETVKDAPFGMNDALYSDENAKAEFIMPNNIWIRVGESTQTQLTAIEEDGTEVDMASGVGRFYNRSQQGTLKVTTPFGYAVAEGGNAFDIYVGDKSVAVVATDGAVEFVPNGEQTAYTAEAGKMSIVSDGKDVESGEGDVNAEWDEWNEKRDEEWSARLQVKGDSVRYVPDYLQDQCSTLDANGSWESVNYEGEERWLWKPTAVGADWAPFSMGRWTEYYGDNCWIPDEPFGYVTHHYGNWVRVDSCGCWYWMPPVRVVRHVQRGGCAMCWHPGRVGWIYSDDTVGWVTLRPTEIYYGHRYWGGYTEIYDGTVDIGCCNYGYIHHAVIVNHSNFYSVNNYHNVRITNINHTTIVNNYHGSRVLNDRVIRGHYHNPHRFHHTAQGHKLGGGHHPKMSGIRPVGNRHHGGGIAGHKPVGKPVGGRHAGVGGRKPTGKPIGTRDPMGAKSGHKLGGTRKPGGGRILADPVGSIGGRRGPGEVRKPVGHASGSRRGDPAGSVGGRRAGEGRRGDPAGSVGGRRAGEGRRGDPAGSVGGRRAGEGRRGDPAGNVGGRRAGEGRRGDPAGSVGGRRAGEGRRGDPAGSVGGRRAGEGRRGDSMRGPGESRRSGAVRGADPMGSASGQRRSGGGDVRRTGQRGGGGQPGGASGLRGGGQGPKASHGQQQIRANPQHSQQQVRGARHPQPNQGQQGGKKKRGEPQ